MSDIYLELGCNDSKGDSRHIDIKKEIEKEIKSIEYIMESLIDNQIKKDLNVNQKINDCRTNELHPISPIEFLNDIPSYLVSDFLKNKSESAISNSLSIAELNKMEESKTLLSELSALDEIMLNQCKNLRAIANGLMSVENLNEAGGECTSGTNIGTVRHQLNVESAGDYSDKIEIAQATIALQSKGYDESCDINEEVYDDHLSYISCYSSYEDEYRGSRRTTNHERQINDRLSFSESSLDENNISRKEFTIFYDNDDWLSFSKSSLDENSISREELTNFDDNDDYY